MFLRISRNGKAYVDDVKITRTIGRMHPELKSFLEIYRNDDKRRSVVLPMDDVVVVPKPISVRSKTRKFEIYRLF